MGQRDRWELLEQLHGHGPGRGRVRRHPVRDRRGQPGPPPVHGPGARLPRRRAPARGRPARTRDGARREGALRAVPGGAGALAAGRAAMRAALDAASPAKWDLAPASGEGEEAWPARKAPIRFVFRWIRSCSPGEWPRYHPKDYIHSLWKILPSPASASEYAGPDAGGSIPQGIHNCPCRP